MICKTLLIFALVIPSVGLTQDDTEQTVLRLSNKKFEWLVKKEIDSLNLILDERVRYVHSNGWTQNKKEIIEDIRSGKLNYLSIDVKSHAVRLYQNMAIVNGSGSFQVSMDGKPLTIELSYTEVYVKENKKWLLASRHSNRMP